MTEAAMVFIGLGLAFNLFGCLGLVRLPDVYNRLQAATKCVTLGTCSVLFGVFLITGFSEAGVKSLLSIVFLMITAPVAAHAISRGCRRGGVALWSGSVVDRYPEPVRSPGGPAVEDGSLGEEEKSEVSGPAPAESPR